MSNTLITELAYAERRIDNDNKITITIVGNNSNGNRTEVKIGPLATWEICHLADECASALVKVRDSINRELDMIKQSCGQ